MSVRGHWGSGNDLEKVCEGDKGAQLARTKIRGEFESNVAMLTALFFLKYVVEDIKRKHYFFSYELNFVNIVIATYDSKFPTSPQLILLNKFGVLTFWK